jgi:hypothetical protein
MPVLVLLLVTAAEAYAKQLAAEMGSALVETVFNQKKIADDLADIKRQLLAISKYLIEILPNVIYEQGKRVEAEDSQNRAVEKVTTVLGAIAYLKEKRNVGKPNKDQIQEVRQATRTLSEYTTSLFEEAGVLISYGQPYYAVVCISFETCIKAYAEMVDVDPDQFKVLAVRLGAWREKLQTWTDVSTQNSLGFIDRSLDNEYAIAVHAFDGMDVRKLPHETRYLLAWKHVGDTVQVYGGWFAFDGNTFQGDEPLGAVFNIEPGSQPRRAQVLALAGPEPNRFMSPEWFFDVLDDSYVGRPAYDAAADRLGQLLGAFKAYPTLSPPAKKAVTLVRAMQDKIDAILANPKAAAAIANNAVAIKLPAEVV